MRIIQVVLRGASAYEQKCQRLDYVALSAEHEVIVASEDALQTQRGDVAHVYATGSLPAHPFRRFPLPFIASADLHPAPWSFRRPHAPRVIVSPRADAADGARIVALPEAVDEAYWSPLERRPRPEREPKVIGSVERPELRNMVEQTVTRLHRFRDDLTWLVFDRQPTPEDLTTVDVWVDPATSDDDYDGCVAEALVTGTKVVAARTPINVQRLEQGRTGFLVPPRDPNETTHAILTALFKPEVAESKQNAARQTASKFRVRQRLRVLSRIYETLIP